MKAILGIGLVCVALIGVMAFVMAADQTAYVTVNSDIQLSVNPTSVDFGSLIPGATSAVQTTSLTQSGASNIIISISTNMSSIFGNVEIDLGDGAGFKTIGIEQVAISANAAKSIDSRITIPIAYKSNSYTGTITYTAMEA